MPLIAAKPARLEFYLPPAHARPAAHGAGNRRLAPRHALPRMSRPGPACRDGRMRVKGRLGRPPVGSGKRRKCPDVAYGYTTHTRSNRGAKSGLRSYLDSYEF